MICGSCRVLATAVAAAFAALGRCFPALPGLPAECAARSEPAMTDFHAFMTAQNGLACAMIETRQHPGQLLTGAHHIRCRRGGGGGSACEIGLAARV